LFSIASVWLAILLSVGAIAMGELGIRAWTKLISCKPAQKKGYQLMEEELEHK